MKKKSRRIKYATYKSLLSDCNAYDYDADTKTIMVDFPEEVLQNHEFVPEGWESKYSRFEGGMYFPHDGSDGFKQAEIWTRVRDGITIYYCRTLEKSREYPYGEKHDAQFLSYEKAVAWCNGIF